MDEIDTAVSRALAGQPSYGEERREFSQWVHLRLLDNNGRILGKYRGQGPFQAYVDRVVKRLLADFRNLRWGRYRPSAGARRLGACAVLLEEHLSRDGWHIEEAVELVFMKREGCCSKDRLHGLAPGLARRHRAPRFLPLERALGATSPDRADAAIEEHDELSTRAKCLAALEEALRGLSPLDRALLRSRYLDSQAVASAAADVGLTRKAAYSRLSRSLLRLRRGMIDRRVTVEDVRDVVGKSGAADEIGALRQRDDDLEPRVKARSA